MTILISFCQYKRALQSTFMYFFFKTDKKINELEFKIYFIAFGNCVDRDIE